MNNINEKNLNTIFYILVIVTASIFLYIVQNEDNMKEEERKLLVTIARILAFITASYFVINAIYGLNFDKSNSQYKQVIASILILIAALTRLSIKEDIIEFR